MSVRFGYTILYVPDVAAAIAFYENAFGLSRRFVHDSGLYAELDTGATTLSFAHESMAESNGFAIRANRAADVAAAFEVALVCDEPRAVYDRALGAGATPVKPPAQKPWGQLVGYVRDPNGCLVELCSAMGG